MQRNAINSLIKWKEKKNRKPLIVYGARQVGKTWLLNEFAKNHYKNFVYVNFDDDKDFGDFFNENLDTKRIIKAIEDKLRLTIDTETLIIFDEIQECNRALVSLKYFCENAPQYHIIAAGSLLGVAMHSGNSFPVGKVNMLTLYPLTFLEFLSAIGEERLVDSVKNLDFPLIKAVSSKIIKLLKYYFYVGGMPEAVFEFAKNRDFEQARQTQKTILLAYQADFSKHIASADIPKVGLVWDSISYQLAKDNNKFLYKEIKHGARAREYENAIRWLINSGIVHQLNKVSLPNIPLSSYQEREHFKLYMLDVGLFSCKSGLELASILTPDNNLFTHFKGALMEQYVIQELKAANEDLPLFYWASGNRAEIDFIFQHNGQIIPLEVKSAANTQSKSLKVYKNLYSPQTMLRSSLIDYSRNENLYEIPLYIISQFAEIINIEVQYE
jgi:predicted AAA+ superfamily ATPase